MSVFKVMDGRFGEDGLESSWSVFVADTSEECFRHIIKQATSGPLFVRWDACSYWVEEHDEAEKDSPIWVEHPYCQKMRPEYPEWFISEFNKIKLPTTEELRAAIHAMFYPEEA